MLCGALREKLTCILILLLCIIAYLVAITSQRPIMGIQGARTTRFIDNHLVASTSMLEYVNNDNSREIEAVDMKHSSQGHVLQANFGRAIFHEPAVSSRTRQKRSYGKSFGFEFVSGSIIPKGASIDMKTLFAHKDTERKLYHRSSSTLLQILPNGDIIGTAFFNKYSILLLKSMDHVENKTLMKILGKSTGRYIAMTSKGVLYTTKDPHNTETNFLHEYAPDTHDAYISQKYRRYITFCGSNGNSSPAKARRLVKGSRTPTRSRFLLLKVSQKDMQKSEGGNQIDSYTASKPKKIRRKCGRRRKTRQRKKHHRRRCKIRRKTKHHRKSEHANFPANSRQERRRHKAKTAASGYFEVT